MRLAFFSLRSNRMRTLLTMLGIIVGIASVISIVAVGQGAQEAMLGNFEEIGASTVLVLPDFSLFDEGAEISPEDVNAIRREVQNIRYAAPISYQMGSARVGSGPTRTLNLYGMDNDGFNMLSPTMQYGRSLSPLDYQDGLPNALIDAYTATTVFGDPENALDQDINIELYGGISARVHIVGVGTFDSLEIITNVTTGSLRSDEDIAPLSLFIPLESVARITGSEVNISILALMGEDPSLAEPAAHRAIKILERRHNSEGQDAYRMRSMSAMVDQFTSTMTLMAAFISVVASISLIVGGIGVMNIMLVNVTERTREIGIRKALGATPGDIELQFLSEAIILTSLGGLIGLGLGLLLAKILATYLKVRPLFSLAWSLASLLFSAAIGLLFGIAPAKKAARMNPIDALRYE